ncbi:MAG: PorV/PorQ family protein, partial [Gemmatimonadaceae bacterium]|nr:PorV/PorQ family protein [Gemmatimonadaceae bacterium]
MRPLPSKAALLALQIFVGAGARAQSTSGTDAGVFLLLPTGAQAVGMGQAVVAAEGGSESVWWNPAGLARQSKRELAIHHSQTIAATGDVLAFVAPSKIRGTLALSVNILNPGEQQVTDDQGQPVGVILPRDLVFAVTYAKSFGEHVNAGVTYKMIQFRVDCSGQCATVGTFVNSSHAADAGLQYKLGAASPVTLGIAVRNVGGKVKSGSSGASDALPTRTDAGLLYHVAALDKVLKDTKVNAAASVITTRGE